MRAHVSDTGNESDRELSAYLEQFLTPQRLQRIDEVLSNRTRHLTVVLEDVFQAHNISAVLRSSDAFGVQDVHVIENYNRSRRTARLPWAPTAG